MKKSIVLTACTLVISGIVAATTASAQVRDMKRPTLTKKPMMKVEISKGITTDTQMWIAQLSKCSNLDYVTKTTDMTSLFTTQAGLAGYSTIGSASGSPMINVPQSFVDAKENAYCSLHVDPPGFPHHISVGRNCRLDVGAQHVGGGNLTVTAKMVHSGCYNPSSSSSKPNWPMASADVIIKTP